MCSKPNYTVVSFFLCQYNGQQSVSPSLLFLSDKAEWPAHNAPHRGVWPVSHNHTCCQARLLKKEERITCLKKSSPFPLILIEPHSSLTWSLCSVQFFYTLMLRYLTVTLGFLFLLVFCFLFLHPTGLIWSTLQSDFISDCFVCTTDYFALHVVFLLLLWCRGVITLHIYPNYDY